MPCTPDLMPYAHEPSRHSKLEGMVLQFNIYLDILCGHRVKPCMQMQQKQEVYMPELNNQRDFQISRRQFLIGSAASTLVILGSTAILSGCSQNAKDVEVVPGELEVAESQVVSSSDFNEMELSECAAETAAFDLPMGSIGHMDCDDIAVMIYPGETNDVLTQMGLLAIGGGGLSSVLSQAVGHSEGFVIYDARCNDNVIIWVESNFLTSEWRVYISNVESSWGIGTPVQIDEGDADFDPPMLCVCGSKAYWTVMPTATGGAKNSDSYLKCATMSNTTPQIVYTSHGRMITNPQASGNIVTIVPRAETSSTRYQMTALDNTTGELVAAEILPSSMKAYDAIYMDGKFVFSIEATYSYGGGIANFGTYAAMDNGMYMRFNRTPMDTTSMCGKYLMVKSSKSVCGVDLSSQSYFAIPTYSGCESYGDFLLCAGERSQIVTYTSVPAKDGSGTGSVRVRVYSIY